MASPPPQRPQKELSSEFPLVLHGHRVGIDGFFACNPFKSRKQAAIVVLIRLKCDPALLAAVVPSNADKVLLRFGEGQQGSESERKHSDADGRPHAPVHVLSIEI